MAESRALIPGTMYTQTDKLKESKDLSANLVGGDFEGQYKGKQQAGWRQNVFFKIALGVLTVWLLAITVVREVQLSNLRQEVDILTANMIVMSSTVKKISDNRLFNEFQTLEDTIYADEDQDNFANDAKDTGKDRQDDSLEKLHDLTVLEDVNQPEDDEDLFDDTDDDDDEVSGDWYMDYDRRGSKVVTTNMVRLKPEDFTDAVLKQDSVSHIREIKRLLNENPEIDSVFSALPTEKSKGTPKVAPKETPKETPKEAPKRERRSFFPEASSEANSGFAVPNAISNVAERRKNKKFASSRDANIRVHSVSRSARNSEGEEGGYREPFVAAHFHGNTSHLTLGIHEHFKGNGLIRVKHEHDVWFPSPWTLATPHPRPSLIRNRYIHVHHSGVYFVYAQIYYLDSRDVISWVLQRKDPTKGWETLLQCAQSSHSVDSKPNSCFSASALYLKAGDILAVKNTREELHSIMQQEKSFVGLIKLADAEMPDEEI